MATEGKKNPATTKVAAGPKFAEGDWITAPGRVYLRIMSVIDQGMGPLYGVWSPRSPEMIKWETQYQLDDDKMVKDEPNFGRFKKLAPGDILRLGQDADKDPYVVILARQGNSVLVSHVPDKRLLGKLLEMEKAMRSMADLEDGQSFFDDDELDRVKKMSSQLHSSKIAGEWRSIRNLTLMHWEIIEE